MGRRLNSGLRFGRVRVLNPHAVQFEVWQLVRESVPEVGKAKVCRFERRAENQ